MIGAIHLVPMIGAIHLVPMIGAIHLRIFGLWLEIKATNLNINYSRPIT